MYVRAREREIVNVIIQLMFIFIAFNAFWLLKHVANICMTINNE